MLNISVNSVIVAQNNVKNSVIIYFPACALNPYDLYIYVCNIKHFENCCSFFLSIQRKSMVSNVFWFPMFSKVSSFVLFRRKKLIQVNDVRALKMKMYIFG